MRVDGRDSSIQSGLYFFNGKAKPAAKAFQFPFTTTRVSKRTTSAWGRSPTAGLVAIQRRSHRAWSTVKTVHVGRGGVFTASLRLRGPGVYRARVNGRASNAWRTPGSLRPRARLGR